MQLEPRRNRKKLSPRRLGEKIRQIRWYFHLTQGKMLLIVNPLETTEENRARIGQYERGIRVPSLVEVKNYADHAGIGIEILTNDDLQLPDAIRQAKNPKGKSRRTRTKNSAGRKTAGPTIYYVAPPPAVDKSHAEVQLPPEAAARSAVSGSAVEEPEQLEQPGQSAQPERLEMRNQFDAPDSNRDSLAAKPLPLTAVPAANDVIAADIAAAPAAPISESFSMVFSEAAALDFKAIYHEAIDLLPINRFTRLTPAVLIELMIAAACDDFRARGAESAIARRLQLFTAAETGG